MLKQTDRETNDDGEGPHAGIGQGRVETVAAEILAQNCFHVNWQLSQEEVENPVVAPVSDLELILTLKSFMATVSKSWSVLHLKIIRKTDQLKVKSPLK